MNNIITDNEAIQDEDAFVFYEFLSQFMGRTLEPHKDRLLIIKPPNPSRNSEGYLVYCQINQEKIVAFKRCSDNPEFIRRELSVAKAQSVLGFPSYKVLKKDGIILRNAETNKNCKLFTGWENKTHLVIDYGIPTVMKTLREIKKEDFDMLDIFERFGKWAAFNCLLGVRDRHDANFVISRNDGSVLSVDNEEGPFDSNHQLIDIRFTAMQLKSCIQRFLIGTDEPLYKEKFRQGFVDGWTMVSASLSSLEELLTKEEFALLRNSISFDPKVICSQLFF